MLFARCLPSPYLHGLIGGITSFIIVRITKNQKITQDVTLAITFSLLSYLFGQVQFDIPGLTAGVSSLNEVPLLISVFYISSAWYMFIIAIVPSVLGTPPEGSIFITTVMHIGGLLPFWFYYRKFLIHRSGKIVEISVLVLLGVAVYYLILLIPIMGILNIALGRFSGPFIEFYTNVTSSVLFEMTTTGIIITLYLLQHNSNLRLQSYNKKLEDRVKDRTRELNKTVQKLSEVNEKLRETNESLDKLVSNRTFELEQRNIQLTGYAFINSHLMRAPVARIMGLANLIRYELRSIDDTILLEKFQASCEELDKIFNLLSSYLSDESVLSQKQLLDLQDRIRIISEDILEKNQAE